MVARMSPALPAALAAAAAEASHPVLPAQAIWAGVVVIGILAVFLAAAVIGPIFRALAPQEMPTTHSHSEPPGHH
jgi:hypothetical protein